MTSGAEPQFGRGEEPIDDHVMAADAIVDQFGGVAFGAHDEERGHLALADAARELNEDLSAVVKGAERPPRRAVPLDCVAEVDVGEIDAARHGLGGLRLGILPAG